MWALLVRTGVAHPVAQGDAGVARKGDRGVVGAGLAEAHRRTTGGGGIVTYFLHTYTD